MTAVVITNAATYQENTIANFASGSFNTDTGTDYSNVFVPLGFKPRLVVLMNVTDGLTHTWVSGMTVPGAQYSVAAGDKTLLTSTGFTINGGGAVGDTAVSRVADPGLIVGSEHTNSQGGVVGNGFTIYSTMVVASKLFCWYALG